MQFIKSLFCSHGLDNRTRFFAICSTAYVVFIMLTSAFTGKLVFSLTILALMAAILSLTSLRRLKDAKLNIKWLFVPNVIFVITALIIIFSEQNSSYYLLIVSALCLAALLTYPSINNKTKHKISYTLGYYGPVDMSEYQQVAHQGKPSKFRIEPTLAGDNSAHIDSNEQAELHIHEATSTFNKSEQQVDLGELIRLKLLSNKKAQLAIAILLSITLIGVGTSWLIQYFSSEEPIQTSPQIASMPKGTEQTLERNHQLDMPDNFSLFLSQHQGIIINWQADNVNSPLLWAQTSAQGDKSCQQVSFNKGKPIRTLKVVVEDNTALTDNVYNNYFASFSPLDSKALIQALAFRGSFSLCGYDFSLKGSQAALGQNKEYANWVDY